MDRRGSFSHSLDMAADTPGRRSSFFVTSFRKRVASSRATNANLVAKAFSGVDANGARFGLDQHENHPWRHVLHCVYSGCIHRPVDRKRSDESGIYSER